MFIKNESDLQKLWEIVENTKEEDLQDYVKKLHEFVDNHNQYLFIGGTDFQLPEAAIKKLKDIIDNIGGRDLETLKKNNKELDAIENLIIHTAGTV